MLQVLELIYHGMNGSLLAIAYKSWAGVMGCEEKWPIDYDSIRGIKSQMVCELSLRPRCEKPEVTSSAESVVAD